MPMRTDALMTQILGPDLADKLRIDYSFLTGERGATSSDRIPGLDPTIVRDPDILRNLTHFQANIWTTLHRNLEPLNARVVLGACALLSYHPTIGEDPLTFPGRYDPEL